MITRETIYKRTNAGKVQIWYAEIEGGKFRTVSGQQDGKKTVSEWTICHPKNVGRSNATTAEEQAVAEVEAMYTKRLEREYRRDITKIDIKEYTKPMKCLKWYDEKDMKKRPGAGTKIGIQPKYDGMRCLASVAGCKSQDGLIIPGAPHISDALSELFADHPEYELDGELYNHEYKEDFEGLMSALKKEPKTDEEREHARRVVQYYIYDIVLPNTPYWSDDPEKPGRYQILEKIFDEYLKKFDNYGYFKLVEMVVARMDADGAVVAEYDDMNVEKKYEGSIVRVFNSDGYQSGRRPKSMFKVKLFMDDEFPIVEVLEGKGNWAGHAKAIRVRLHNGNICKASVKGDKTYAKKLWEMREEAKGKMATVTFLRYSKAGMLNLPIFKSIRWDV